MLLLGAIKVADKLRYTRIIKKLIKKSVEIIMNLRIREANQRLTKVGLAHRYRLN